MCDGKTLNFWARNMKDAKKLRVKIKNDYKECTYEVLENSYEVSRNKDSLIDLLNNVT
tara:strand:- start:298 stop:471 length:174 start_codon:yes stop_codon:yes gene_type:complete